MKAFVPYPATSGAFLLRSIPWASRGGVGIANACEEDVRDLWQATGNPLVVTLGRNAQAECVKAHIPFGAVPHPQYIRRFHYRRAVDYGRLIARAGHTKEDACRWPND